MSRTEGSVLDAAVEVTWTNLATADAARLAEILLVLGRNGLVTVARRGRHIVIEPRQRAPRALAVALRRSFVELGPTLVKLGQLIASSPGLFPPFLADELRTLLDRVPPEPFERVQATIERELRSPLGDVFRSFEEHPVAAASVAQVHRAVLLDGTTVAVKVRRPHLRGRIERDLRLLHLLATLLARLGALGRLANPVAIVDDLATTLRAELDLRLEAEHMAAIAANLRSSAIDDIVVPAPIPQLVGERVLTMTFIDGVPVDDGEQLRAAGHDLEAVVRSGVRAWIDGALVHGLFHGDVHAGNLFVTPNGQVAFLDFGIVGRLDDQVRSVLRSTLPALLMTGDYRAVVHAVFDLGAATADDVDLDAAERDVRQLMEPLLARGLADISYGEMLADVVRIATDYGVQLPRELVLVVKQLMYFERYAKELAPTYQLLSDVSILETLT